jgi:hypothetical protein
MFCGHLTELRQKRQVYYSRTILVLHSIQTCRKKKKRTKKNNFFFSLDFYAMENGHWSGSTMG